jgi:hypothetical protein
MEKLKELILIEADKLDKLRKRVYNVLYINKYYLNMLMYMLNDINNWSFLKQIDGYGNDINKNKVPKTHYRSIYNKFVYWTKNNVFYNAFYNYHFKNNTNILLLDATSIYNKYGSENISINPEYTKKKVTKVSVLTNTKGFIYSVLPFKINTINKKYSTSIHDVKMIDEHIIDINKHKNIKNNSKYFSQLCDKAYKYNQDVKKIILNKNMNTITPDKKNAVIKNEKFKNIKLKKRIYIEHTNLNLKRYERLLVRKDRNINTFMSWIYITSLLNNIRINNKI